MPIRDRIAQIGRKISTHFNEKVVGKPYGPKRIDLYILSEVAPPFFGGILFFTFIFLMFQALRLAEFFIIHGVSGILLLKMISLLTLSFLPTALPMSFLIAILVGFGRLSADSELVAMKASGMSIYRLAQPVFFFAAGVVALSLALNMSWVPWGDRLFKGTLIKVSNTKVVSSIKEGTFTSGFFDLLIYADRVDSKTSRLENVFLYDEREPRNPMTVVAREGEIVTVKTKSELGAAAMLKLYNGNIHRNDTQEDSYQKINFNEYRLYLKVDEGADTATTKPRMIPFGRLKSLIRDATPGTEGYRELRGELWRRYSVALTPLIFVLLGIGYGTVRTRTVRSGAALIALIVIILYWGIQSFATVAVQKGYLHPIFGMNLANLILLVMALHKFRLATF